MLATRDKATDRRGIVLVLVLAMLGLLALIAVTFAAYASQAKINTRNFAMSVFKPQADELFDFALSQLIGDTADPRSVIRGHSMARDMYGNDAANNGYLTYGPSTGQPFLVTNIAPTVVTNNGVNNTYYTLTTNILSSDPGLYGYNFQRWIIRMTYTGGLTIGMAKPVDVTFEILVDNPSGQYRTFLVSPIDGGASPTGPLNMYTVLSNPTLGTAAPTVMGQFNNPTPLNPNTSNLAYYPFVLDGRYLRAFNGPGLSGFISPATFNNLGISVPESYYGNFRYNPDGMDPNQIGMDEDYDACDLDNWFLAIQSADGQVMIPSFHRPAIIRYDPNGVGGVKIDDWQPLNQANNPPSFSADSAARILRPIQNLGNDSATFPDLLPTPGTGKITYDVDNDGDGVTDSVWLDLGYPARRDSRGKLYKPLFAFMVIGLNGRIPLNTAGNMAQAVGPAFTIAGTPQQNYYAGAGQAAHLGNSSSEIDPTYALQNAFDASTPDPILAFTPPPPASTINFTQPNKSYEFNSQVDSAGIDVRLTQLRNVLAGTRPQSNPTPGIAGAMNYFNTQSANTQSTNADLDIVFYSTGPSSEQQPYFLPNGIASLPVAGTDASLIDTNTQLPYLTRHTPPVGGRWGEASSIPGEPLANPFANPTATPPQPQYLNVVTNNYNNPVRPGYSLDVGDILNGAPRDAADDNFNAFDPYPLGHTGEAVSPTGVIEQDYYDFSGALMLPVDRIRRFVTPMDINGTGEMRTWGGTGPRQFRGADGFGRVQYRSYFRPAGSPGVISPGTTNVTTTGVISYGPTFATPWTNGQAYQPDLTNNLLHGFESFRFPGLGFSPQRTGGTPFDLPTYWSTTNPVPATFPTYDTSVNTVSKAYYDPTAFNPNLASDGVNEAEELNLYTFNPLLDSPYGPTDLEWLYRKQDVDGSTLTSRLSQLAPISLVNGLDGQRRRRLFALDAFESNGFVWTNDNPGGAFPYNSSFYYDPNNTVPLGTNFTQNGSGILQGQNASMLQLQQNAVFNNNLNALYPTPSLAQRDRKINLNMPFPVSNDPNEAVRQKWINDVYQLMKVVLPPRAVDTPEELAQLSQYILNIVDFRDPDATMTHWINPDVLLSSALLGVTGTPPPPTTATPPMTLVYQTVPPAAGTMQLDQYGMEYNPVAINESLMYTYMYSPSTGQAQAYRFLIELVNTQTGPALASGSTLNAGVLDLGGYNPNPVDPYSGGTWDIVFTGDDPYSRPDPYRGELPIYGNIYAATPLNSGSFLSTYGSGSAPVSNDVVLQPLLATPTGANQTSIPFASPYLAGGGPGGTPLLPTNYFYVFGNTPPTSQGGSGTAGAPYEAGPIMPGALYNPQSLATTTPPTLYQPGYYTVPQPGGAVGVAGAPYIPAMVQSLNTAAGYDPVTPVGLQGSISPTYPMYPGWLPGMVQAPGGTSVGTAPPNYLPKVVPPPLPATGGLRGSEYVWVCLRRPANPFAPVSALNPMLVVDSMRVPYVDGTGTATTTNGGSPAVTGTANTVFSAQRLQPYRGGHAVPPWSGATPTAPTNAIDTHYGYSEQIVAPTINSLQSLVAPNNTPPIINPQLTQGLYSLSNGTTGTTNPATGYVYHTLGLANEGEMGSVYYGGALDTEVWEYLPFHDRDFSSVAELMLVPASAPGLFTKQFAEFAPSQMNVADIFSQVQPLTTPGPQFQVNAAGTFTGVNTFMPQMVGSAPGAIMPTVGAQGAFATYWLYATATTQLWNFTGSDYTTNYQSTAPTLPLVPVSLVPPPAQLPMSLPFPAQPHSTPYLSDRFFYSGYGGLPSITVNGVPTTTDFAGATVGGYMADGWFKMFEFLEVPTSMIGGVGPAMNGTNFDWARQDSRPGQLNLNMIIDEEVYLSLLGKQTITQVNGQNFTPAVAFDQFTQTNLNFDQIGPLPPGNYVPNGAPNGSQFLPLAAGMNPIPMVVTSTLSNGSPASAYPMAEAGMSYSNPAMTAYDPVTNYYYQSQVPAPLYPTYSNGLKASWVQFLWLRHGGSGYMFGYGNAAVGQNFSISPFVPQTITPPGFGVGIPAEIPFHSLSYPDIDQTVMRPAALPPTFFTNPVLNTIPNLSSSSPVPLYLSMDPGVRTPEVIQPATPPTAPTLMFSQGYPSSWSAGTYQYPGVATTQTAGGTSVYYPYLPPPVPARRLFQTPDAYMGYIGTAPSALNPAPSNASETGDPLVNNPLIPLTTSTLPGPPGILPTTVYSPNGGVTTYYTTMTDSVPNLYWPLGSAATGNVTAGSAATSSTTPPSIGGGTNTVINQQFNSSTAPNSNPYLGGSQGADFRQNPFWRSEEMQRVLSLTTVRTHQYAVWVTIGFFEVTRQGDLGMASSSTPWLAYDVIGPELRATAGASPRFRQFALVDRLRLNGFNPTAAGQFQSAVVYKKRIQ